MNDLLNANFLFASLVWGSVGFGYFTYGLKQRRVPPVVGGLIMMIVSYLVGSAMLMSLISIAVMTGVYWVVKRGY